MTILVRASEHDDLPAILAIYRPAVLDGTASFELEPPSLDEMARRRAALLAEGFPYLVAEGDGIVGGYAYAGAYRPRPAYRHAVEDSIYIAPAMQGKGIGKTLLGALIAACEALGKRQMVAVIGDSASTGSITLHRALGFTHAGTVQNVGFKHGRWLDQVIYQRALGSGAGTPPAG
jgi:L-amino acid N-acyltransferase YncA